MQKLESEGYDTEIEKLLNIRNSQVAKFIQLIAVLCYYMEQDDIDQCSTSFQWITRYLEKHCNTPHQMFFI